MPTAVHVSTQVLPGKKVVVSTPELHEGQQVEVFVVVPGGRSAPGPSDSDARPQSFLDRLPSLPPGPRSAVTWEEVERRFQEERDAWDR